MNIVIMINNNWTLCKYIELIINVQKKPVSLCMKTSNKYQGKFLNYDSLRKKKKNQGKNALDQRALWLLSPNGNIISSPPESIEGSFSGRVISNVCKLDLLSSHDGQKRRTTRNNMEVETFFFLRVYFLALNRLCYFLAY